ncbi:amino acid ABC transporter permease [uncultured Pseudokineococcus sp.]|uniref:amino acid ABC transporter permease n=1 Tax=uncultured Pseudokineococcus sp. TaxID=1642928 RepID=UPI00261C08B3|nr:amino acid ABC transporter permease [uncultured Pseudokineococcus sp.]
MSAPTPVLFDELGPRGRRRVRVATGVAAVLIAAVVVAAVLRLHERGQFDAALWAPLLDPRTEEFPLVWQRLGRGAAWTVVLGAAAMVLSLVIGVVIAVARLSLPTAGRIPLIGVVELLRGLPVVVTILLVSVALPAVGWDSGPQWALVIGLTLYNCVIISEILRAGVLAVPRGQVEAGSAVGLTRGQVMRGIQLPQAFRSMLPALISQLVVILKDTALGAVVLTGLDDLARQGLQLRTVLNNGLQTLLVVAVIYIAINLVIGRLAVVLERRLSRSRSTSPEVEEAEQAVRA